MQLIKDIFICLLGSLLLILLLAYFWSDRIIFQPPAASYHDTAQVLKLKVGQRDVISAVYLPNAQARYTLLISHGNAEDIGYLVPWLRALQRHGFAVFAYDYRGYGTSTGKPSEQHVYEDVNAAYLYLTQTLKINPQQIIAYGRSLGSGAAIDLAAHQPVAGLIVESPLVTAFRVITGFSLLPFDKFYNLKKIKQIRIPILVMHGINDKLINIWHGKAILAAAQGPKQYLWVTGAGHNDLLMVAGEQYWQALDKFVVLLERCKENCFN